VKISTILIALAIIGGAYAWSKKGMASASTSPSTPISTSLGSAANPWPYRDQFSTSDAAVLSPIFKTGYFVSFQALDDERFRILGLQQLGKVSQEQFWSWYTNTYQPEAKRLTGGRWPFEQ